MVETALKTDSTFADEAEGGVSALLIALYHRQDEVAHLIRSYRSEVTIFEAAALGEIESIEGLLGKDPAHALAVSPDGFTALGLAAYFGHVDVALDLVKAGADVNRVATGPLAAAPLHSALANGFVELARALVEVGAKVNLPGPSGWLPLHYAADLGDADLALFLLQHGADAGLTNEDGQTAAELGREVGHDNVSEVLEA